MRYRHDADPREGWKKRETTLPARTTWPMAHPAKAAVQEGARLAVQRARFAPRALTASDLVVLQRTIGNAAVTRLLREQVYQRGAVDLIDGGRRGDAGETDRAAIQRQPASSVADHEVTLAQRIRAAVGRGTTLEPGIQRTLEAGLGTSLAAVRVHTDGEADHLARAVDAVAFTSGADIFFRTGTYNPRTPAGLHVLAHEVTHTVQQAAGPVAGTPSAGGVAISDRRDRFERAAAVGAQQVMAATAALAGAAPSAPSATSSEDTAPVQTLRVEAASTSPTAPSRPRTAVGGASAGAHGSAAAGPVYVQRYFFDVGDRRLTYDDTMRETGKTYNARQAPNLKLKHPEQRGKPQRAQVFVDNRYNSAEMKGYLKDTLKESPQVIEIGQKILDILTEKDAAGPFMLGVARTLDGKIRVATSGSTSGHVTEAVREMNKVYRDTRAALATQESGEVLSQAEKAALDDPRNIAELPANDLTIIGKEHIEDRFDAYISKQQGRDDPHEHHHQAIRRAHVAGQRGRKRDKNRAKLIGGLGHEHVIVEHVNCAAPQLLASAVGGDTPPGALNIGHLTEIWWDPEGEAPVLIDGVRYHHRQRVPSCHRCENNLRIVVYREVRDAIRNSIETTAPRLTRAQPADPDSSYGKELVEQRAKERLYNRFLVAGSFATMTRFIVEARDILDVPATATVAATHLDPVLHAVDRAKNRIATDIYNRAVDPREYQRRLDDDTTEIWKKSCMQAVRDSIGGLTESSEARNAGTRVKMTRALQELRKALSVR